MLRQYKIMSLLTIAMSLFIAQFSYAGAPNDNMVFQSPSVFNNGHLYGGIDGAFSFNLLSLDGNTNIGTLTKNSKDLQNAALGLQIGYAFDKTYVAPIRIAALFIIRPSKKVRINPVTAGSGNQATLRLSAYQVLANVYYDFYNNSEMVPYLGVGAGFVRGSTKLDVQNATTNAAVFNSQNTTKTHLSWDAEAGIHFLISQGVNFNIFTRFTDLGNYKFQAVPVGGGNNLTINSKHLYAIDVGAGLTFNIT